MLGFWLATCTALLSAAPEPPPDVIVVCPEAYRAALAPWVAHRREQGHRLAFLPAAATSEQLRKDIAAIGSQGGVRFVVLVGDDE